MQNSQDQSGDAPAPTLKRRLLWLLACTALGLAIGLIGYHFTSSPKWFLALPAALAIGWLFFANPDECQASCGKGDGPTSP